MGARDFTLADVVKRNAETFGDHLAFVFGAEEVTHAQHLSRVTKLAGGLASAGVGPGDRVVIVSRNNRQFVELYGAAAIVGALLAPVNWRLASDEIAYIVEDCQPKLLMADDEQSPRIEQIRSARNWTVRCFGIDAASGAFEDVETLYDGDGIAAAAEISADAPCVLLYTAATGGRPKGALVSHNGLLFGTEELLRSWALSAADVNLGILPLFHLAGLIMMLAIQRAGGATVVFAGFEAPAVLATARDRKASLLAEFPPILETLLDAAATGDLSALRVVVGLDSPETIAKLEREWPGATFWAVFGQSETSGFVTMSPYAERPGSAGKPTVLNRVRVVDDLDRPLAPGQVGEIAVRGPSIFHGYWKCADDTAFTLRNGWHHTGDLGTFDDDGYLWYKGRSPVKELIKSGGENVYPSEVEQVIAAHEGVAEVAVIGIPDKKRGEAIKAICVLRPNFLVTQDEIADFVAERIARFKKPRRVAFVESLPKLENGAIDRAKVKEIHTVG